MNEVIEAGIISLMEKDGWRMNAIQKDGKKWKRYWYKSGMRIPHDSIELDD